MKANRGQIERALERRPLACDIASLAQRPGEVHVKLGRRAVDRDRAPKECRGGIIVPAPPCLHP